MSRVVVLLAIALTVHVSGQLGQRQLSFVNDGVFAWDASYYRDIAVGGYGAVEQAGLRFFPLLPMLGWVFGLGVKADWGVLIAANVAAFAAIGLVHRVVVTEGNDERVAARTAWFFALFPAAAVLVLPYAEGLLVCAAALVFIGVRKHVWWLAIVAGFLGALARPTGVLLAVPALVALWRVRADRKAMLGAASAMVAPVAGLATFLVYANATRGDFLAPLRLFSAKNLRGGWVDPFTRIARGFGDLFGDRFGSGLHVVWALFFIALLVVMARRLPAEYTWWSAVSVVLALCGDNLDSFERYCLVVFPFAWVLAALADTEWKERTVLAAWTAGLVGYTVLAVSGIAVP